MKKVIAITTAASLTLAALILAPLMLLVALMGEANNLCTTGESGYANQSTYTGSGVAGLTQTQTQHAAAVIAQARQMGIPDQGIIIALAVVSQESTFQVYANDGKGGDLAPDQRGIARSLQLPHDAVGTDHGSLGIFQQQWPWWGTMEELMDPALSAAKFYNALGEIKGWENLPVTVAAQRVQRSAYPSAYADDEPLAREILATLGTGNDPGVIPVGLGDDPYQLGQVQPRLRALVDVLAPKFGIITVGGYRASATDPNGHPSGLAADFMVPTNAQGRQQGTSLAEYARANAQELGVDYVIWQQQIWSVARGSEGWRPMSDRGSPTANHEDHVHVNVRPDGSVSDPGGTVPAVYNQDLDCTEITPVSAGGVVYPIADGAQVDSKNYGQKGEHWADYHTGTDFSVPCGTPVVAAHAGTVRVRTDQAWAGRWLVQVETAPGQLATWYAHMESLTVADGDVVTPGQQIGTVGEEGNAFGCHLHFEVHPQGGGYTEDDVDPTGWLAANAGTRGSEVVGAPDRLTVATLNVLGDSHTRPGGNKPGFPGSETRTALAVRALNKYRVDVVALQEIEPIQVRQFRQSAPGWKIVAGPDAEAVAWRTDAASYVSHRTLGVPYFNGRIRQMPIVTLKVGDTAAEFSSFHNPANVRRFGDQTVWRHRAHRVEIQDAENARLPLFVMGDMNDRQVAYCMFTASGTLTAAAGGSNGQGPCTMPPSYNGIDWIFATHGMTFTGFQSIRDQLTKTATDHPLVVADVIWGGS